MFLTDVGYGRVWVNPKYIVCIIPPREGHHEYTKVVMLSMDDNNIEIGVSETMEQIVTMMDNPIARFMESNYYKAVTENASQ